MNYVYVEYKNTESMFMIDSGRPFEVSALVSASIEHDTTVSPPSYPFGLH